MPVDADIQIKGADHPFVSRGGIVREDGSIRDEFVEHATQAELRALHGLNAEGIFRAAKEMLDK